MINLRVYFVVAAVLALCGCGSPVQGKCETACAPPASGACATQNPTACVNACVSAAAGLSTLCAQCIAEHTGWGTVAGNGGGPDGGSGTPPTCGGYEVGKATSSACAGFCGPDAG